MAYSFNGTTQYLRSSTTPITGAPLTMACWCRNVNTSANYTLMSISDLAGNLDYIRIYTNAAARIQADVRRSATTSPQTSTSLSAGVWNHACGVFASPTSHSVYLNAGGLGSTSTNITPLGIDVLSVGGLYRASPTQFMSGQIAIPAIWNIALSSGEIYSLSKGFSPLLVRPQNLVFYAPLNSNLIDICGGRTLTDISSPQTFENPRIYY
jgi:hypothetical protein